jgi:flagellar M-ring protein FliF
VNGILDNFRQLGPVKLALLGGVMIGLVAFFMYFAQRLSTPNMGLLYSELSAQDSGQIVAKLEAQNIPFELRAGGSQIWVPNDKALRLRMSFAEQGMPRGGSVGYEIFDKSDIIGATNFLQNLNQLRALEGELSRTIGSLGPISTARVHLVVPRRELFNRDKQEPTASVVLKMRDSGRLPRAQVQAIQHLVAAAVPALKPGRVSIIDDKGTLLARGQGDGDEVASLASTAEEARANHERRIGRNIEDILERTLGPGKVRAEVSVELDFDRIVTNTESYDPDGQVVRSTQNVTESSDSSESGQSSGVSVAGNLPDGEQAGATNRNNARTARNEETINYEITKTTKSHVRETGSVRRMSVAVIVDGVSTVAADGARNYAPRSAEDMERITALVRSAIGFDEKRGDKLEVANLPFAGVDVPEAAAAAPAMFDFSKQDYFRMAELAVLSIVAILVILLVARPILSHALTPTPPSLRDNTGGMPALPPGAPQAALAPPSGGGGGGGLPEASNQEMIDLDRVEGRVKASSIKKVGEIVEKHPEEAVAIVRNWMYQET